MTTIYDNATKIARMQATINRCGPTAVLEIGTAGFSSILVSIALNNPVAPAPTGVGVMTMAGFPRTVTAAAGGVPAVARVRTATGGTTIIDGWTVGLSGSGAEVIVDTMNVSAGQAIDVQLATVTHAA